jgi:ferredoxin-NADP reductase
MEEHIVKILSTEYITHNVKRFRLEKPAGYSFVPGQATEVAINKPEWKNERRPFTFTSLNGWPQLEFTIKIYRDSHGVTEQLEKLQAGEELIIHDIWGAISYKGPGVFIAAGAGITPFIAILRQLQKDHHLAGNSLIFSNMTSADIILREEFEKMLGSNFYNVLTREHVIGFADKRIDEDYLINTIKNFSQHFYICGPDQFVKDIEKMMLNLGAKADAIIFEK